jgi:hypothetical protein
VLRVPVEFESPFGVFVAKAHAAALVGNETRALLPERPILRVDDLTTAPKACLIAVLRIPTIVVHVRRRKLECRQERQEGMPRLYYTLRRSGLSLDNVGLRLFA